MLVLAPDGNLAAAIRAALFDAAPRAEVDIAHSLEEAQQVVIYQKPDLFVLDVDATQGLGQEFLYGLRTSHPNARAIILTGVHLAGHRERAAGLGAIHFLEKPFLHDDFVALVGALLQAGARSDTKGDAPAKRKILVVDDSVILLNFVKEILSEANYEVAAATTAEEGLRRASEELPELILLDYILPDMKGDEFLNRLLEQPETAALRVIYMSGFGADLPSDPKQNGNVIGSLNKPFTSELLLSTVETYLPSEAAKTARPAMTASPAEESAWESTGEPHAATEPTEAYSDEPATAEEPGEPATPPPDVRTIEAAVGGGEAPWWDAPAPLSGDAPQSSAEPFEPGPEQFSAVESSNAAEVPMEPGGTFFSGDTSFFSLNWALHTISAQKLTGTLRALWNQAPIELLARAGQIVLATTRDAELYCPEAPITLVNIEEDRTRAARDQQRASGRPLFITLAQEGLILREPAVQLVQHYGQKLFAQLWTTPRVRIVFELSKDLPHYAESVPSEGDVDHWALSSLRFIQFQELGPQGDYDPASVPAYTRDGFERVQQLRLTVAEAQFASQFNGVRSIAQIAKNLRLDVKFARLTLFRFLALEIVECWPAAAVGPKPEKRGVFGRMFGE